MWGGQAFEEQQLVSRGRHDAFPAICAPNNHSCEISEPDKHDTDSELLQKIIPMKWTILHLYGDDVKFYAHYERRQEQEDKSPFKASQFVLR